MQVSVRQVEEDFCWYLELRAMKSDDDVVIDCYRFERAPLVPREGELFTVDHMTFKVVRVFHEVTKRCHEVKVTGVRV